MTAVLPHPILSATVALVWVLLVNDLSVGTVLLALVVGFAVPKFTSMYWPERAAIGDPRMIAEYAAVVLYDIVVSNIDVARLVLFRRAGSLRSGFITVPLDLRSPEAITVLAGTITMTPGTLTVNYDPDARTLTVHALDIDDADAMVAQIKDRYERRLGSIFR